MPAHAGPGLLLIAALTAAAVVHVHCKLAEVQLGYQMYKALHEHKRLMADSKKLQVEFATLRSPRRVRAIAMELLGLVEPLPQQLLWRDGERKGKLAMGKATAERQARGNVN